MRTALAGGLLLATTLLLAPAAARADVPLEAGRVYVASDGIAIAVAAAVVARKRRRSIISLPLFCVVGRHRSLRPDSHRCSRAEAVRTRE